MNDYITDNYKKVSFYLLLLPIFIIGAIIGLLYSQNALNVMGYVNIQKNVFYFLNGKLSQFPILEDNLTQIGDAFIGMSLLSILIIYTPKMWEALLSASLVSLVFSKTFKEIFDIPRPATIFDNDSFNIIGETLVGYSSLPSGHSITTFTLLTVCMFAFAPKKRTYRYLWFVCLVLLGLLIAFTRVGVGAHHPFDVIIGSTFGFISGLLGIFITRKYKIWTWIANKKFYPIFILIFLGCLIVIITKIIDKNLFVFYLALLSLIVSLFIITKSYVQNFKK
ncbi:phosphatase PAP2 family protein [Capnocytophaga cynodegmi]|uniref:PAP2 family protein n=1 Tax=Capnocytophaga cynodegmi TaxID=28189 RepID=A0A0B7HHX3_9FLAO|nr:phosphatase PAP2 family protein [Capnocytophaga cynodegmi]CEN37980.1 PAP2 family protein [Capnocytophaga cynodegmi]CEN38224.1 PAP2 family protein [Capnocytophaga cynodegmi]